LIVLAELAFCVFPFREGKDIEMVNRDEKDLFMKGTKSVAIISGVFLLNILKTICAI
jgi:hypothetical protein